MTALPHFKDGAYTTLSENVSAGSSTLKVALASKLTDDAVTPTWITIWNYVTYLHPLADPNAETVKVTAWNTSTNTLTLSAPLARSHASGDRTAILVSAAPMNEITSAVDTKLPAAQKGAANGVAELDSSSKVPVSQLPAITLTEVYQVASESAQIALDAQRGDVAIRTDENKSYCHNGGSSGTMSDWTLLRTPTDNVLSVFGRTGAVTQEAGDYTLDQVTETAANKLFTAAEKTKLGGIETGATADMSATELLTAVKTVDGHGSGLDADTVDGIEATGFGRRYTASAGVSKTTWTKMFAVSALNLSNLVRVVFRGTSNSTVINAIVDIAVEHPGHILVTSHNGNYTQFDIKIACDANGSFTVEAMIPNAIDATTYIVADVYPLCGQNVVTAGLPTYTTTTLIHYCRVSSVDTSSSSGGAARVNGNLIWNAGNDGAGSGMDADLLDGNHASAFATSGHTHTAAGVTDFDTEVANNPDVAANTSARHSHSNKTTLDGTQESFTTALKTKLDGVEAGATADMTPTEILEAVKTVDGSGSGLDADKLDGNEASAFSLAGHTHTAAGVTDFDTEVANNTDVAANTSARHSHTNKTVIDGTQESFTTTLKTKLDGLNGPAYAPRLQTSVYISKTDWTPLFYTPTVYRLSNTVRITFEGTTTNVVMSAIVDIDVSDRLVVSSLSGGHTAIELRVTRDAASKLRVDARAPASISASTATTVTVYTLGGCTVSDQSIPELTPYYAYHYHTCSPGLALSSDNTNAVAKINGNTIWNAGNDGASSGLDADLIDGLHAADLTRVYTASNSMSSTVWTPIFSVSPYSLGCGVRAHFRGTSDSTVVNVIADIITNYPDRVTIRTVSGGIATLDLRVSSKNDGAMTVEAMIPTQIAVTPLYTKIYPLNNETVTLTGLTVHPTTLIHHCLTGSAATTSNAGGNDYRGGNIVWNAGNDGTGSGLDADLLDGEHAAAFAHLAGNETVNGVKTFGSFPVTPSSLPTTDYQVANKKYVDSKVGAAPVTLTDAATVSLDASLGDYFRLSAAGDRTIAAPTNAVDGKKIIIEHTAVSADRTLTLATGVAGGFAFGAEITGLTATISGKKDIIGAVYNSVANRWYVIAYMKGY